MKIEVVEHDPEWAEAFDSEKKLLQEKLGKAVSRIHHIGSTSVKNLAAKPVIDIMLEVESLESIDLLTPVIEAIGYEAMGEFGIPGRRYFRKGKSKRTHQIHAFKSGDANIERHLAFRDYLKAHPAILQEYGRLKKGLAETCSDMDSYCDGKDAFIKKYEAIALEWSGRDGPPQVG